MLPLIFGASILQLASALPFKSGSLPTVKVQGQTITGIVEKGVEAYRGIPYAEPPLGDLRFKLPVPFNGSLDGFQATEWGDSCISLSPYKAFDAVGKLSTLVPGFLTPSALDALKIGKMSEDCLTINVWRPAGTKCGDDLPVMVWFYGGAFEFGSSPVYAGDRYIKASVKMGQSVLFVSVPYRMGPWGFLGGSAIFEEGSSNAGLYDQRLGLEWVQDNIRYFGGDPAKVTVMGESAGAMSISDHFIAFGGDNTYNGNPLFRAAIFQSGSVLPVTTVDSSKPQMLFDKMATAVGCSPDLPGDEVLACLRELPEAAIRNFVDTISSSPTNLFDIVEQFLGWGPRVDGDMIAEYPYDAMRSGKFSQVPYITGNQEDEGTLFSLAFLSSLNSREEIDAVFDDLFEYGDKEQVAEFLSLYPSDPAVGAPYRTGDRWATQNQTKRASSMMTDVLFHIPRRLFLASTDEDVDRWVYRSDALHNTNPLGTFHATDIIFQFFGYGVPTTAYLNYFVAFANNLDPNVGSGLHAWPKYTPEEKAMINIGLTEIADRTDVFTEEGREEAIQLGMDYNFLMMR